MSAPSNDLHLVTFLLATTGAGTVAITAGTASLNHWIHHRTRASGAVFLIALIAIVIGTVVVAGLAAHFILAPSTPRCFALGFTLAVLPYPTLLAREIHCLVLDTTPSICPDIL